MITEQESGLSSAAYAALRDGSGPPQYQYLLQRRNLKFDTEVSGDRLETALFDVASDGTYFYVAVIEENELRVKLFTIATQTWVAGYETAGTSPSPSVGPVFGNAQTLFYVNTDGDVIRATTSDNWATSSDTTWVDISAEGISIYMMGAADSSSVYLAEWLSSYNTRFHYATSGNVVNSDIYWPHKITGMDALHVDAEQGEAYDHDLIVISSILPYQFGLRVKGSEVQTDALERSGMVAFKSRSGMFSDHWIVDQFDDSGSSQYRKYPHLSLITNDYGSDLIACVCYGKDGSSSYNYGASRLYFSADGEGWSLEHVIPTSGYTRGMSLQRVGDYAFLIDPQGCLVSYSTELTGHIADAIQIDISERVSQSGISDTGIRSTKTQLLNAADWKDTSILSSENTFSLTVKLGVYYSGSTHYVTVSREIVDMITRAESSPEKRVNILSRSMASLLTDRVRAPHVRENEAQVLGADNFWDNTGTGYGGLRHTAAIQGYWSTDNNILKLRSNNKIGVAITTFNTSIWSGSIQARVAWASNDNSEYVGLIFREFDEDNYYAVVYEQLTDKIHLTKYRAAQPENIANSPTLSWSLTGVNYMKVVYRYSKVIIYTSHDGENWTYSFSAILPGESTSNYLSPAQVPIEIGGAGYLGKGYSAEDTWEWEWDEGPDPIEPPETPPPSDDGGGGGGSIPGGGGGGEYGSILAAFNFISGTNEIGTFIGRATTLSESTTWIKTHAGLPLTASFDMPPAIHHMDLDPFNPDAAFLVFREFDDLDSTDDFIFYNPDWRNGGTWQGLLRIDVLRNITGQAALNKVSDVSISLAQAGLLYVGVHYTGAYNHIVRIAGYGSNISYSPMLRFSDTQIDLKTFDWGTYPISIACGNVSPNKVWVVGQSNSFGNAPPVGRWVTDDFTALSGPYWEPDVEIDSWIRPVAIINPYRKSSGAYNDDTELYLVDSQRTDDGDSGTVARSTDGGDTYTDWTHTGPDGYVPPEAYRDRAEFPFEVGEAWYYRDYNVIKSFPTSTPTNPTVYTIPGVPTDNDGPVIGWHGRVGWFYIGSRSGPEGTMMMATKDANSGEWTDVTGDAWDYIPYNLFTNPGAYMVRCTPHWTE